MGIYPLFACITDAKTQKNKNTLMFYLKPLFLIDRCFSADLVTELKFATELLSSEKMQTKIHTFIQTLR